MTVGSDFLSPELSHAILTASDSQDPFYLVDLERAQISLDSFRKAFSSLDVKVAYSYKTNYIKSLVLYFHGNGCLSEVVSPFEVDLVRTYDIPDDQIIYNGPLKSLDSISSVLRSDGLINADSLDDLQLILSSIDSRLASSKTPRIGIRLCIDEGVNSSRFGILASNDNIRTLKSLFDNHRVPISCIHFHYPVRSLDSFKSKVKSAFSIIKTMFPGYSGYINLGGGFPSPVSEELRSQIDPEFLLRDISEYGEALFSLASEYDLLSNSFILEPGTALAANSLHLVGSVLSLNKRQDYTIVNTNLSKTMTGGLKSSVHYPFIHLTDSLSKKDSCYILSGFTCVESDVISPFRRGSLPMKNDKIVFPDIGSYSFVFKPSFITGSISTYVWDGNVLRLASRPQLAEDINALFLA